jgi:acyl-coenzyme A thioesterase PaaI-like protein
MPGDTIGRTQSPAETTEEMLARVRASFDRQGMMSTLGVEVTSVEPGKVEMSLATMTTLYNRPGISG